MQSYRLHGAASVVLCSRLRETENDRIVEVTRSWWRRRWQLPGGSHERFDEELCLDQGGPCTWT